MRFPILQPFFRRLPKRPPFLLPASTLFCIPEARHCIFPPTPKTFSGLRCPSSMPPFRPARLLLGFGRVPAIVEGICWWGRSFSLGVWSFIIEAWRGSLGEIVFRFRGDGLKGIVLVSLRWGLGRWLEFVVILLEWWKFQVMAIFWKKGFVFGSWQEHDWIIIFSHHFPSFFVRSQLCPFIHIAQHLPTVASP